MSTRSWLLNSLVALLVATAGFAVAAVSSALYSRYQRATPWRKLRVDQTGEAGSTTTTSVAFQSTKVPIAAIEVTRDAAGAPQGARIDLRSGVVLTVSYQDDGRPAALSTKDGTRAVFSYGGTQARVTFSAANGEPQGDAVVRVPVDLRGTLKMALASWSLVGEAWAQEDAQVAVTREVALRLSFRSKGGKPLPAGDAQVEASCEPLTCLPTEPTIAIPGPSDVRVAVTGTTKKSALEGPASSDALSPFKDDAANQRRAANRALPHVGAAVAAMSVTALACGRLQRGGPLCVTGLYDSSEAGIAIDTITSHHAESDADAVDERAVELFFEEQARAALDRPTKIQVCVSRRGYARACTDLEGRPLAKAGTAPAERTLELRAATGGTLEGRFEMSQSDGADCAFSRAPKSKGPIRISFDLKTGVVSGKLSASESGTRPGLTCSLGTGDMRWSQSFDASVSQSFTPQQLEAGGKLAIRLTGTMKGTGNESWSNCRRGSQSGACPGARSGSYNYPIQVIGNLDLDAQTGSGTIVVSKVPLATGGSWRAPAGSTP